jgi:NAD(P)H-hydrate epimerase
VKAFSNITGNAGLAKGGSGDILTGIITALLAQKYSPLDAALLGVYIHGLAADLALQQQSMESMMASDVLHFLGAAFSRL